MISVGAVPLFVTVVVVIITVIQNSKNLVNSSFQSYKLYRIISRECSSMVCAGLQVKGMSKRLPILFSRFSRSAHWGVPTRGGGFRHEGSDRAPCNCMIHCIALQDNVRLQHVFSQLCYTDQELLRPARNLPPCCDTLQPEPPSRAEKNPIPDLPEAPTRVLTRLLARDGVYPEKCQS